MKKLTVLALVLCILCSFAFPASASGPSLFDFMDQERDAPAIRAGDLASGAAILMDADTGEILFQKNANSKMYPASITKVMTALLVAENCSASETVSVSAGAVKLPSGYSHIGLRSGDTLSVENAMYAMMLPSANDAANALGEHVAGSKSAFAAMMNKRAKEIGATGTNFVNAAGIPDKQHYTTAYDMALITREAAKNKDFMNYFGATSHTLPAVNAKTKQTKLQSYQYMLISSRDEYDPDVIGGKIGYTKQAGHTMSTVAKRDGRTLICIVLKSTRDGKYEDTKALLDYGFNR